MATFSSASLNTQLLVYGYIRILRIKDRIIPSSIIDICINFYRSNLRVICVEDNGGYSSRPPHISIAEIGTNTNYQCNLQQIGKITRSQPINYHIGICYVEDFKLPKHLQFTYKMSPSYNVIFRTGDGRTCCAYILDEKNSNDGVIGTYIWNLPSPKKSAYGASALYSAKHGLITVGNHQSEAINSSLNVLNFDYFNDEEKTQDKWQWKECAMKTKRQYPAAAMITDDTFICVGGNQNNHHLCAEMYDFNTQEWIRLNDMRWKRKCAGIYVDKSLDERVYVGGGFHAQDKFEYCVLSKNEWFALPDSNVNHETWPIIWSEYVNVINVASVEGCKTFERLDLRENKWHVYVGNIFKNKETSPMSIESIIYFENNPKENKSFDDFFGATISPGGKSRLAINIL